MDQEIVKVQFPLATGLTHLLEAGKRKITSKNKPLGRVLLMVIDFK